LRKLRKDRFVVETKKRIQKIVRETSQYGIGDLTIPARDGKEGGN